MKDRCYNKNNPVYHRYGGRGITIYQDWLRIPSTFVYWSLQHGWVKGLSIERIDNNGIYCPNNCKYITVSEQSQNRKAKDHFKYAGLPLGITIHKGYYQVQLTFEDKLKYAGRYKKLDDALVAYDKATNGIFPNTTKKSGLLRGITHKDNKYRVRIVVKGKYTRLGLFSTLKEACSAIEEAKK